MTRKTKQTSDSQTSETQPLNSGDVTRYDYVPQLEDAASEYNKILEKKTLRLIDARIVPLLGLLYSFALIDRSNLGIARVVGMGSAGSDMDLTVGNRFSLVLILFYLPYTLLQLPSNLMLRKVGPKHWLGFCVLGWGAAQCAMGFATHWLWLLFFRILLGAFEAGFFPAQTLIVTTWYKRHEVQKRLAGFYVISIFASGFGPILAYMLSKLHGLLGIPGYAWIFIVEGSITMFLGYMAWLFLPDFPDNNTFLEPKQTAWVLRRIEEDRGDSIPDAITTSVVLNHLADWKLWAYGLMFMCSVMPTAVIGFFVTIILKGMGWSTTEALFGSSPPFVFAAVSVMFFAWMSDKTRHRAGFIAIQVLLTIVGLLCTTYCTDGTLRYIGICLATAGSSGSIPGILAYSGNNVVSQSKRIVTTAVTTAFGGVGGVLATVVFRQQDYPRYLPGMWFTILSQVFMLVLLGVLTIYFWKENKRCREGKTEIQGQPGFLYTL
jgi:MFS family permease